MALICNSKTRMEWGWGPPTDGWDDTLAYRASMDAKMKMRALLVSVVMVLGAGMVAAPSVQAATLDDSCGDVSVFLMSLLPPSSTPSMEITAPITGALPECESIYKAHLTQEVNGVTHRRDVILEKDGRTAVPLSAPIPNTSEQTGVLGVFQIRGISEFVGDDPVPYVHLEVSDLFTVSGPKPVNFLMVREKTDTTVELGWQLPDSGGSFMAVGYDVVYSYAGSVSPLGTFQTSGIGLVVPLLAPSVAYDFRVSTIADPYGIGLSACDDGCLTSAPVTVSAVTLGTPVTPPPPPPSKYVPSEPININVSDGDASATIRWSPPADDGGAPVTDYRVSRDGTDTTGGGAYTTVVPASQREFTFTLLRNGDTYTLSVAAINAIGTGPTASETATPTAPVVPPPPPPACDASYPDFCIPPPPPDKNCTDFTQTNFRALAPDPHGLDADKDGIACEKDVIVPPPPVVTPPPPVVTPPLPPVVTPPAPAVSVYAAAVSRAGKLYVDVDPNQGRGYYTFRVQKWSDSQDRWVNKKGYRTKGIKETRTVNLGKGSYRVVVAGKYGLGGAVSETVYLKR